jgi:hypothetical protein
MIMGNIEFDREPPANLTTMVMAFGGWIDAGRAATGALRHLTRDLGAARLARIDPEEFFVFTQERPEVRLKTDGGREILWPPSEFFAWHPEDGRDGLLLFCGPEPHQDAAERRGMQHVGFMGQAPHYLQDSENPAAIQSLVSYVARLLNLSPDMSHFAEAIQDFRTQCDRAVARDRATREHVRQLEQEYDAAAGEERPSLPGGELDSDKLMQELQDFLRKQREGGGQS